MSDNIKINQIERSREHLANERTFLAWIRTSIALMGFGFVIVKFSLFLKQLSLLLDTADPGSKIHSAGVGIIMVALGVILALLSFLAYKKNEKRLRSEHYIPTSNLSLFITLIMMIGGILLILYLIQTLD